jgi:lipoyl(octanoyl) transferase
LLSSTQQTLAALGASVHYTERGGDVTFHGPGQLVIYPVLSLRQLGCGARAYVEGLEDVMCAVAARHGVLAAGRLPGAPGVWVGTGDAARKLGAVGVRISGGVTTHGAALNVATNLACFAHIVPCGIADKVRKCVRCVCVCHSSACISAFAVSQSALCGAAGAASACGLQGCSFIGW